MTPCRLCGSPTPRGTGRTPREYCGRDCADGDRFLRAAEVRIYRQVEALRGQGTPERIAAFRRLRGRLWRLANAMNRLGPPLPMGDGESAQGCTGLAQQEDGL